MPSRRISLPASLRRPAPAAPLRLEEIAFSGLLLGFAARLEKRFEADTAAARAVHLQRTIIVGLLFYNVFNLSNWFLAPDSFPRGLVGRLLLVTPVSLWLAWVVPRVSARVRERFMLAGMINAAAMPVLLFWACRAPNGAYSFCDIVLVLVFGTMLLGLRFPHAVIFTFCVLIMSVAAILTHPLLDPAVGRALAIQLVTASVFVLYGSYTVEAARRGAYLASLREIQRSSGLETDRDALAVLSTLDSLTGLANRRMLDATLAEWLGEAERDRLAIALLMIDVDHFKLFNDCYGHLAGDECLCRVTAALRGELREGSSLAARYGGEEFVVLLRDCSEAEAARVGQRLCAAVMATGIAHAGRPDGLLVVTASVGAVIAPRVRSGAATSFFAAADAALYEAKREGRNRCVLAVLPPAEHARPVSMQRNT